MKKKVSLEFGSDQIAPYALNIGTSTLLNLDHPMLVCYRFPGNETRSTPQRANLQVVF